MDTTPTSPISPLSEAWHRTAGTRLAGFFLMLLTLFPVITALYDLMTQKTNPTPPFWHFVLDLFLFIISTLVTQAMARLGLARSAGENYSTGQLFTLNQKTFSIILGRLINYLLALLGTFFILCLCFLIMFFIGKLIGSILLIILALPLLICSATTDAFIALAIQNGDAKFYNAWLVALKKAKTYHIRTIGYVILTLLSSMVGFFCALIGLMWALPFNANLLTIVYLGQKEPLNS